jgi:hypothetical protein
MIRQQAREENPVSRRSAVHNARAIIPVEDRVLAPRQQAMGLTFNRHRRKAQEANGDEGLDVANPIDIIIPPHLQGGTILDEVIHWPGGEGRTIAYVAEFGMELLARPQVELAIDGTYQVGLQNGFRGFNSPNF